MVPDDQATQTARRIERTASATTAGANATAATRTQSAASSGVARNASATPGMNGMATWITTTTRHIANRKRFGPIVTSCETTYGMTTSGELVSGATVPGQPVLDSDRELDRWLRREVGTTHHVSGTCRMGPASDPMNVIDERGRVHGVEGLRVADASIMPDCVRANTNATVMMIGERMADILRR